MCSHGTTRDVRLCQPREVTGRVWVPVDLCIADLVQALNDAGVHTLGSCCGHGREPGSILYEQGGQRLEMLLGIAATAQAGGR